MRPGAACGGNIDILRVVRKDGVNLGIIVIAGSARNPTECFMRPKDFGFLATFLQVILTIRIILLCVPRHAQQSHATYFPRGRAPTAVDQSFSLDQAERVDHVSDVDIVNNVNKHSKHFAATRRRQTNLDHLRSHLVVC